ncbi:hypothetical protein J437_LFUL009294 [Ladona fulva]|uniref:Uncharacterized protein n=1 Tax=Ladona fulva TaxID=123851 RepID=A0A8K0P2E1_LADFU|nr:hypothetical protein J437_LFUL009294 [Ladona fulva]
MEMIVAATEERKLQVEGKAGLEVHQSRAVQTVGIQLLGKGLVKKENAKVGDPEVAIGKGNQAGKSRRNRSGDDRSRSSLRSRSWSRSRSNSKSRSPTPSSRRPRSYRRSPSSGSQDSHSKAEGKGSKSASSSREAAPNTGASGRSSEDQLSAKLQAAIRAAQSADQLLRQQGVLLPPPQSTNSNSAQSKTSQPSTNRVIVVSDHNDPAALDEINAPGFVQHNFVSNGRSETYSEQAAGIISTVVSATLASKNDSAADKDSLFHPNLLVNSQVKMDKWVKKLFTLRQKAINGEPLV